MTIRPARAEDVAAVLPLVARVCDFHQGLDPAKYGFVPGPERSYERWLMGLTNDPRSVFLVAEREGRLVGFIVGTIERDYGCYRIREYGFVHDLWVEPEYRNEGIGRQMVMLAVERFAQMGLPQVRLDVLVGNESAKGLFESCGFRPTVVEMVLETGTTVEEE
jgi:ribosomal protein S18 acetylase RimI-like enzyme